MLSVGKTLKPEHTFLRGAAETAMLIQQQQLYETAGNPEEFEKPFAIGAANTRAEVTWASFQHTAPPVVKLAVTP